MTEKVSPLTEQEIEALRDDFKNGLASSFVGRWIATLDESKEESAALLAEVAQARNAAEWSLGIQKRLVAERDAMRTELEKFKADANERARMTMD